MSLKLATLLKINQIIVFFIENILIISFDFFYISKL